MWRGFVPINNRGQIIGSSYSGDFGRGGHAFIWDKGIMSELPALDGQEGEDTSASDINNRGQVVGYSGRELRPVMWENGIPIPLETLPPFDERRGECDQRQGGHRRPPGLPGVLVPRACALGERKGNGAADVSATRIFSKRLLPDRHQQPRHDHRLPTGLGRGLVSAGLGAKRAVGKLIKVT